jgi:hypothetical protein
MTQANQIVNTVASADATPSIYVTITADSHAEFLAKLAEMYAGFQPLPATAVTKDGARRAIKEYVGRYGLAQGRNLLQMICGDDVLSLSQVPPSRYVQVVAAFSAGAARH